MKRFGLFGLVLAVSLLGACNDNGGGSNFGIPDAQLGGVKLIVGTSPSCDGGTNDGGDCSPNSDCPDAFCTLLCTGPANDEGMNCSVDEDCALNCEFACDRGVDGPPGALPCSHDTDCPDGTCTTALIHDFEGFFTHTNDSFVASFMTNTDSDGDGFTPAAIDDTAPLGSEGEVFIDFLDDTPDCVIVTWGPQFEQVFEACGDPIEATFPFPE